MSTERIMELIEIRNRTDKVMSALLWIIISIVTLGVGGAVLMYLLIKRRNEHIKRDSELMDAIIEFFDNESKERNIDLRDDLASLRRLCEDHTKLERGINSVVWPILNLVLLGLPMFFVYYLLSRDLSAHDSINREYVHTMNDALLKMDKGRVSEPLTVPKRPSSLFMIIGVVLWIVTLIVCFRTYQGARMLPGGIAQGGGLLWGVQVILRNTSSLALIIILIFFMAYWTYIVISDYNIHFKRQWGWEDDLVDRLRR